MSWPRRLWAGRTRRWIAAGTLGVAVLATYASISFLIAQGLTRADRDPQEDHPARHGVIAEDVEFRSRGGDVMLSGWYLGGDPAAIPGDDRAPPAVVFVHGLNSVRSAHGAVELAARLVDLGYAVLLFDLRGHGSSGDAPVSGGYFERWDVLGAYDYLVDERGHAPGDVGVIGFSMGAASAILAAAIEPGIAAIVADSPYASATELLAREAARETPLPGWLTPVFIPATELLADLVYGIDVGALEPQRVVARLAYPLLVIHSAADRRIPVGHGERVAKAARAGTVLWTTAGAGHVDSYTAFPDGYVERVAAYLAERRPAR
ncbi:MAG: alpha/beta fold hydrolase [Chloroflexi bacterium]|nr:alpha/beta fold hydrolase [Chloroflexota bacterium]